MDENEKQQRVKLAREKWRQKKAEQAKQAKQSEPKVETPIEKEPEKEPVKEPEKEPEKPVVEDYTLQISNLLKEVDQLKKTKPRKLKKIEYYGSDDEKESKSEPPMVKRQPQFKPVEKSIEPQVKIEEKPKINISSFFGTFI